MTPWTVAHQSMKFSRFKNTGAVCHFLLQGIFLAQGSNVCLLCLLNWQVDSLPLASREAQRDQYVNIFVTILHRVRLFFNISSRPKFCIQLPDLCCPLSLSPSCLAVASLVHLTCIFILSGVRYLFLFDTNIMTYCTEKLLTKGTCFLYFPQPSLIPYSKCFILLCQDAFFLPCSNPF